jgi:hypothetical protein
MQALLATGKGRHEEADHHHQAGGDLGQLAA